jgi:hypothetical protein
MTPIAAAYRTAAGREAAASLDEVLRMSCQNAPPLSAAKRVSGGSDPLWSIDATVSRLQDSTNIGLLRHLVRTEIIGVTAVEVLQEFFDFPKD